MNCLWNRPGKFVQCDYSDTSSGVEIMKVQAPNPDTHQQKRHPRDYGMKAFQEKVAEETLYRKEVKVLQRGKIPPRLILKKQKQEGVSHHKERRNTQQHSL